MTQSQRRTTILVVEDNPDDLALTLDAFEHHNVANDVVIARDGQEALDQLLPADGRPLMLPSVVLLDLKLPKVGGLEVLQRLRQSPTTRFLPVVVLTTSSQDEDRIASYELGANSFVRKPVAFDDFMEAVRLLGLYWAVLNEAVAQ